MDYKTVPVVLTVLLLLCSLLLRSNVYLLFKNYALKKNTKILAGAFFVNIVTKKMSTCMWCMEQIVLNY